MIHMAMFKDRDGLPRAYGVSTFVDDAVAIAKLELEAYRDEHNTRDQEPFTLETQLISPIEPELGA